MYTSYVCWYTSSNLSSSDFGMGSSRLQVYLSNLNNAIGIVFKVLVSDVATCGCAINARVCVYMQHTQRPSGFKTLKRLACNGLANN